MSDEKDRAIGGRDLVGDPLWPRRPVSDEAIETIVDALLDASDNNVDELEDYAEYVLDGLRAAGFELYRPDECEKIVVGRRIGLEPGPWSMVVDWDVGEAYLETDLPDGTYRLVPVENE